MTSSVGEAHTHLQTQKRDIHEHKYTHTHTHTHTHTERERETTDTRCKEFESRHSKVFIKHSNKTQLSLVISIFFGGTLLACIPWLCLSRPLNICRARRRRRRRRRRLQHDERISGPSCACLAWLKLSCRESAQPNNMGQLSTWFALRSKLASENKK